MIAPALVIPWHFLWIIRFHFDDDRLLFLMLAPAVIIFAYVARKRWRDAGLLRSGAVATGIIEGREDTEEWNNRVWYSFDPLNGNIMKSSSIETGYKPAVGSVVPVFFDANKPKRHIVACASWFEAH